MDDEKDSNVNILEHAKTLIRYQQTKEENNFIFVGNEKSGKTSCFNLVFSKKEKDVKSYVQTCGINYNNAVASFGGSKKILMNGYELGGGLDSLGLIKNLVFDDNIKLTVFILVIDLEKPEKICETIKTFNNELEKLALNKEILDLMLTEKKEKIKSDKYLELKPWNVVIVGSKYDLLEKVDM